VEKEKPKKTIKAILKELEKDELIEIIIEITKINQKNKEFLEIFLNDSDEINFEKFITDAKKKIFRFIFGTSVYANNQLKLREAKKEISDCSKVLKNYPSHIADLKLYYVETCNAFTKEFGDISEQFYNSVISTFEDFCNILVKHPLLYEIFRERILNLVRKSRDIGWGYSDSIEELVYYLMKNIGSDDLLEM